MKSRDLKPKLISGLKALQRRRLIEYLTKVLRLSGVVKKSQDQSLLPRSQVLTVMFIDVVGFSSQTEARSPQSAFRDLRSLLTRINDIVVHEGGVVEKSMGDGLLCLFGLSDRDVQHSFSREAQILSDHADQAVRCAMAIQREVLAKNLQPSFSDAPAFPLRIGINTGEVFVGNLGSESRVDYTVIGASVNFAKRLEEACQAYKVLCGKVTAESMVDQTLVHQFSEKFVPIKHHDKPILAFEMNPFLDTPSLLSRGLELHYDRSRFARREERYRLKEDASISVSTKLGTGRLLDISKAGLAFQISDCIGKGTILELSLTSRNGEMERYCKMHGIEKILGEVRWMLALENGGYKNGIQFKNLRAEQQEGILSCVLAAQHI